MVLMRSRTRASPSATILAGVSAAANSAGVALLTPASVACADRTTATNKVNGVMYCSSPTGSGLAAWKRRNAFSISALVHGGASPASGFRPALVPGGRATAAPATFLRAVLRTFRRGVLETAGLGTAVLRTMVPL